MLISKQYFSLPVGFQTQKLTRYVKRAQGKVVNHDPRVHDYQRSKCTDA